MTWDMKLDAFMEERKTAKRTKKKSLKASRNLKREAGFPQRKVKKSIYKRV